MMGNNVKTITFTLVTFLILTLSACSYTPFSGSVTAKEKGGYFNNIYPCGNPAKCAPVMVWHDVYYLTVESETESDRWTVTSSVYESCEIDDAVTRNKKGNVECS